MECSTQKMACEESVLLGDVALGFVFTVVGIPVLERDTKYSDWALLS